MTKSQALSKAHAFARKLERAGFDDVDILYPSPRDEHSKEIRVAWGGFPNLTESGTQTGWFNRNFKYFSFD
jgi:hypothetical protein